MDRRQLTQVQIFPPSGFEAAPIPSDKPSKPCTDAACCGPRHARPRSKINSAKERVPLAKRSYLLDLCEILIEARGGSISTHECGNLGAPLSRRTVLNGIPCLRERKEGGEESRGEEPLCFFRFSPRLVPAAQSESDNVQSNGVRECRMARRASPVRCSPAVRLAAVYSHRD